MREILFRGKLKQNNGNHHKGDWVHGDFVRLHDGNKQIPCIYGFGEVIPETVGQYTGLTDKNGTKIFEGDICRKFKSGDCVSVAWHGTMAGYVWSKRKENNRYIFDFGDLFRVSDKYEVIGNIHDNPELLDGAGNG